MFQLSSLHTMILFALLVSGGINIAFILLDIYPSIKNYLDRKSVIRSPAQDDDALEKSILSASLEMAGSESVQMPMKDQGSVVRSLADAIIHAKKSKERLYFYPKAYLFAGLSDWASINQRQDIMDRAKVVFDRYIDQNGMPLFPFDKVDQSPFGIAAINFYKAFGEEKYKRMADYIFNKIVSWATIEGGLVPYRSRSDEILLVDTLGMVCPFLVRYGSAFKAIDAINLARVQLQYYVKYGTDKDSYLPFHGVHRRGNIKLGPTNWGRGVGWYILALAEYHAHVGTEFDKELQGLTGTLALLKNSDSTWSQFPGSSDRFDSSATTMFLYGMAVSNTLLQKKNSVFHTLGKYIKKGRIKLSSGDTIWLNQYSRVFGDSELSQGMLLLLLGATAKPKI